uniref:Sema domain-containing protein n=1 Tax=Amphilophus citrinellus TaxID=61819 RepID=A0A3Q0RJE4_AMPCI
MVTLTALLTVWIWMQLQTATGQGTCPSTPRMQGDFTVEYSFPYFQTHKPIQNIAVNLEDEQFYIGCQNAVVGISIYMNKTWEVKTGPIGSPDCDTCELCNIEADPEDPVDTDNKVLLLDPAGNFLPYLYICGSTQYGICYFIDISSEMPKPNCLYRNKRNSPTYCPDCLASPLGTKVTIVEHARTSLFFVAASVSDTVTQRYPRRSLSVLRPLSTEDGFHIVTNNLTVLPGLRDSYSIDYIYSFSTKDFVYFISLQRENPFKNNSAFQTRLGRLPILITEMWMYREIILECRYNPKRRRRRSENKRETVYNGLQAAHFGQVGKDLANGLSVTEGEDILYGVFAVVNAKGQPQKNSALCAFPLTKVNNAIDDGVEACCKSGTEQLSRGLCHFQPCENFVLLSQNSDENDRCTEKPTLVSKPYHRLDLFNNNMRDILFTSVLVTTIESHTVGHFGTSDGRIIQVTTWVPTTGPGCKPFKTCPSCLNAPSFMDCGWCSGICSKEPECGTQWYKKSCGPVITEFFPKTAPAGGETEVTLCGSEFQSALRPPVIDGKTHIVTVGSGTVCNVLPEKTDKLISFYCRWNFSYFNYELFFLLSFKNILQWLDKCNLALVSNNVQWW